MEKCEKCTELLWIRVGVTLEVTKEEAIELCRGEEGSQELLQKILSEKRCSLNGNTYIPDSEVTQYLGDDTDATPEWEF